MRRNRRGAIAGIAFAAPLVGHATGFFVNQQDALALGRVNAGAAVAADSPSTVFFNPAGMPSLWKSSAPNGRDVKMSAGVNLVVPMSTFHDEGSTVSSPGTGGQPLPSGGNSIKDPADPTPVPYVYYVRRLGETGGYLGLAFNAPFGQAAKFDSTWFGRYDSTEADLRTANVSLVGAFRATPSVSLGGGIDVQGAKTKLVAAIPNPLAVGGPSPASDGRSVTRGTALSLGFNVGAIFDVTEDTSIGATYRSGIDHRLHGSVESSGLTGLLSAANGRNDAKAVLKLPAMASAGIRSRVGRDLSVYAQYDWFGWGAFDEIAVSLDNGAQLAREERYRNAWASSVGAEYAWTSALSVRGGIRYDRTPTTNGFRDTTVPDSNRVWFGGGATYRMSKSTTLEFALTHVSFRRADIDVTRTFFDGSPLETVAHIRGRAESQVNSASLGASFTF